MQVFSTIRSLKNQLAAWHQQSRQSIALVPTMGNLHAGHLKLVSEAQTVADKVVVSLFVNPTQFGEGEDFDDYPRTWEADKNKLIKLGTDGVFSPEISEIYGKKTTTMVSVPGLSERLCGLHRPGHFDGVATIVSKLFNIVQPDFAVFGEKDFQQLTIIRQMVEDLNFPIKIISVATEREPDGLALSSRNGFLTPQQRQLAPRLYQTLCQAKAQILQDQPLKQVESDCQNYLQSLGFEVDYFSICQPDTLESASDNDQHLVILVAAKLGKPRLIDNLCLTR